MRVLPRLEELVEELPRRRRASCTSRTASPAATLLQQATRETLTGMGLDVGGLTDAQMTDNHGWLLFPNFFMTIRAAECDRHHGRSRTPTAIPNRCIWHIAQLHVAARGVSRRFLQAPHLIEVEEPG